MLCPKTAGRVAYSVDLMRRRVLGLHCLPRPVSPNKYGNYGNVEYQIRKLKIMISLSTRISRFSWLLHVTLPYMSFPMCVSAL